MRSVTDASELRLRRSRPQYVLDESEPEYYVTYCPYIYIFINVALYRSGR